MPRVASVLAVEGLTNSPILRWACGTPVAHGEEAEQGQAGEGGPGAGTEGADALPGAVGEASDHR